MMERLTYKSMMGDYGCAVEFKDGWEEKCAFRNRLGKFEDLGYEPEELAEMIKMMGNRTNEYGG